MMGNEVLEDLNGCDPGLTLVCYTSFTAYTHNHLVVVHAVNQILERIGENLRIGVNLVERSCVRATSRSRVIITTHH